MVTAWVAGVAGIVLWSQQSQADASRIAFAAFVAMLAGAIALQAWLRSANGALSWDGEGWTWAAGPQSETGTPDVTLDAQRVLLIRWCAGTHTRWLWLERARLPARWDDLRRAVYSRAS